MIRLRLLGSVDLVGHDGASLDAALRRSKAIAVLAYLAAARPRGFHRRDKIAALFWPELSTERARAALRVTLSRLRDDLRADVIVARGADEIGLDPSVFWCDVPAIADALREGRARDAAALYRGDFLDGVHVEGTAEELERWIDLERAHVRGELVEALLAHSDVDSLRRAAAIVPTDERVHRQLMTRLLEAGDATAALRLYNDLARRLERDLDLEPSAETTALISGLRERVRTPADGSERSRIAFNKPASTEPPVHAPRSRRWRVGTIAMVIALAVGGAPLIRHYNTSNAARPTEPALRWRTFASSRGSSVPLARTGARMVLDSTNDALIMFGGNLIGENAQSSRLLNDAWRFHAMRDGEMPEWTLIHADGEAPAPRQVFGLAYDPPHDRMIVFGGGLGHTSPCANDTWILDHASALGARARWYRVQIDGPLPPGRGSMQVSYDVSARRLISFGGHDCFHEYENEVWVLQFADTSMQRGRWHRVIPDSTDGSPVARAAHATLYDARSHRLFVHGGNAVGSPPLSDLWYLDDATGDGHPAWHPLRCDGTAPALSNHASAYDSLDDVWLIHGGADSLRAETRDTWRVVGLRDHRAHCRWEHVPVGEPLPNARLEHGALFDPTTRALIIVGGEYQGTAYRDVHVLRGAVP